MTREEAKELDGDDLYYQYDERNNCWWIIGTNSGFCYQDFDREDDAQQYLEDISFDVDEDLFGTIGET